MEDSVKNIKGVNPNPPQGKPLPLGRREFPGSMSTVVRPGKYPDGQDKMGTPAGTEHRDARSRDYKHPQSEQHRRELGSQPYPGKR
jgi:hypothetical protein